MSSPRVVLTGASRGLGLAILKLLLENHNARVATLSRSYPDALRTVVDKYGKDRVVAVQGDIGKPEDNSKVVKSAVDAFGGIDSVVLNAGSLDPVGEYPNSRGIRTLLRVTAGRLADLPQDALVPYIQANILSTIYLVQAALPHLRKEEQSRVVVVSSGASTGGYAAWGLYSMAKAAQNSLVRTLGCEEQANGVSFYSVRPGVIDVSQAPASSLSGSVILINYRPM